MSLYGQEGDDEQVIRGTLGRLLFSQDEIGKPVNVISGGEQGRMLFGRLMLQKPNVLLMDEPCSALDPIATAKVEDLIDELREQFTICIVTHSMQQAARVSQKTAFFHLAGVLKAFHISARRVVQFAEGRCGVP
mgnify:CR=1 FL=1